MSKETNTGKREDAGGSLARARGGVPEEVRTAGPKMKKMLHRLEQATGIDIDGDGQVGSGATRHRPPSRQQQEPRQRGPGAQQGFAGEAAAAFNAQQPQRTANRVHKGVCGECNRSVFSDQPRRNVGGIYFHEACIGGAAAGGGEQQYPGSATALPPGWERKIDPVSGSPFYINHNTRCTQWEPPAAAAHEPARARFCVECGTQFPATQAKFCANCGAQRPPAQAEAAAPSQPQQLVFASQVWQPQNYTHMTQMQNYHVGTGYMAAQTQPESAAIPASGRRKALLIGINYFGTGNELRGCINDVHHMRDLLISEGFDTKDMVILTDDQRNAQFVPTRDNILRACQWLVAGATFGDVLFFHFSGHGSQLEDDSGMEEDGYNETICPVDMRQIVDDELWSNLVFALPSGVRLTAIMDCCHSGTGLDLPFMWQAHGWREDTNPSHSCGDVQLFSGCQDNQTSSDGDVERFKIGGAMTNAFIRSYKAQPFQPYPVFLENLRQNLRRAGFTQRPQLSSSQPFGVSEKCFSLTEGIVPNQNAQVGRLQRRKIRPSRNVAQMFGDLGGGGGMLQMAAGAAVGMMMLDLFD